MGRKTKKKRATTTQPSPPRQSLLPDLKVLAICGFLALLALVVFGRTVQHEFIICDDNVYVYENGSVAQGLTWDGLGWALTACHAGNWHPLTWVSHMFDAQCYGLWPGGHHLTNVLLHAASAMILFLALRQMSGALWCSALAAAMFAIHPLRAESVAWVSERKDVLSGLFWMLTMLAYGWYARKPAVGRYLTTMGLLALGLMAKSMLVTLPCVLLLLDFWPMGRWKPAWMSSTMDQPATPRFPTQSLGWLMLEKLPLLALSITVGAVVAIGQRASGAMSMVEPTPMGTRIANAASSYIEYLWKMIWPANLAIFYPYSAVTRTGTSPWLIWGGIAAGIGLVVVTLLVLWNLRRRPYLAVGWFWYLGTMVPVIGIIQIGAHAMADRYTYLPMIGINLMLVWGGAELASRWTNLRVPLAVAAALLLAVWTVVAADLVVAWKNSFTVFEHAIKATNDNYFAYNHLGAAYHAQGKIEEAGVQYAEAVRIAPNYDAASANLGVYHAIRGENDLAAKWLQNAVRVNPFLGGHLANLGAIHISQGKIDLAESELRKAIQLEPGNVGARANLIRVLWRQGKMAEALVVQRELIRMAPNDAVLLNDTAWMLATNPDPTIRNGTEAVEYAQRAVQLSNGQEPMLLGTLAAAYAEIGQFQRAVQTARTAIDLARQQNKQDLAKSIEAKIPLYEAKTPFREPRASPK